MIGRQAELAQLTAAARSAVDGQGSATVVVGEPGIGKTHLLESFADAARELGLETYAGSAYELEQRRPFATLLDALAVHAGVEDPRRARLAARFEPGDGPAATGFWIGEELLALVDESCAQAPTAIVLDDVQWVDQASLGLIARMCRVAPQQPLAIVLAARPPPRSDDVTRLIRTIESDGGREVILGPLTDDEIAELIVAELGAPPSDSLWRLLRGTAGSPLFVRELIAGLRIGEALRIDDGRVEAADVGLPPSLSSAVRRHLAQLDADTIEVLRLAAVLGGPFTLRQLGQVTGRRAVELYANIGAALEAGVLREDGSRLQFVHDVVRATLYDDIPIPLRADLHRDVAIALDALGAPALEVAEHHLRGASPGDRDAAHGLRRAANVIAEQSPTAAADLLDRAAALLPDSDSERSILLQERAGFLASAGRAVDAERLCRQLLAAPLDPERERTIRRTLAEALVAQSRLGESLEEAQRIVESTVAGTVERARATGGLSWALLSVGRLAEAEQTARETIGQAGTPDPAAAYTASMTLAVACRFTGRATEALEHLDLAAAVAPAAPRPDTESNPFELWRALMLLDLDRLDEALLATQRGRAAAEDAGATFALARYHFAAGSALHARGDVDDAAAEYRAGMELAEELGTGWRMSAYGALASIAVHADDPTTAAQVVAEGEDYLRRTGDQPQLPLFLRAKAELLEAMGRQAEALAVLAAVWRPLLAANILGSVRFFAPDVVRLAVAEGDMELATAMAAAARTAAERVRTSTGDAAALRCHGLIHGDLDAFISAADTAADNPRPLVRAGAHEDAGRVLAAAGRAQEARHHLLAAIAAYERMGAVRDIDRVEAIARSVGVRRGQRGHRDRPAVGWDSLTPTERRVAELVAAGLSNPAIAERMFLSRRTVQTHVSHILTKTGLTSRVEVAAAMARQTT